jgi:hypothetical protein
VTAQRILAVAAAVLLVSAVALATLGARPVTLGWALFQMDNTLLDRIRDWLERNLGGWMWSELALPLLERPVWLVPVSLGLICIGLALSLPAGKPTRRSHHRG